MDQLIMRWQRGALPDKPDWGELVFRHFTGSDSDIEAWLDIVSYGLTDKRENKDFFYKCMYAHGKLEYDKFFIVECGGTPAATLAVICDYDTLEGYIHMVACKPQFRGMGIGTKMNTEAVRALMTAGMETAYLTTDDHRIAAIKSYLRAGFVPDMTKDGHKERWQKISEITGGLTQTYQKI